MNSKLIAAIVVIIVIIAAAAVYVATDDDNDDNNESKEETTTHTVTDSLGRTVEVPNDLSGGIYVFGWSIMKLLSYFDDRQYVEEVDLSETSSALGINQSHYYCFDMTKMKTHADFALDSSTVERVIDEKPSLIVVRTDYVDTYKDNVSTLAKAIPLIAVDVSAVDSTFYEINNGVGSIHSTIQNSLKVLGSAFNDSDRATEVIGVLNDTLKDIATTYAKAVDTKGSLAGSNMGMDSGELNHLYPIWVPLDLAKVPNAASSYSDGTGYVVKLTTEKFITDYDFDVMLYDPTVPDLLLTSEDNQTILKYLYGLQGTENEKQIYVVLISALAGYDMVNLIGNTYFIEYAICHTLTLDQVKEKLTQLYIDLYGESVGKTILDNLIKVTSERSSSVALPLFGQVKVGINSDGKYTFVAA